MDGRLKLAVPIGLSRPSALDLPVLPILSSLHTPSLPLVGCANEAPELSQFHCSVSCPHRGGQRPSPLARCVWADCPTLAVGEPSPMASRWASKGQVWTRYLAPAAPAFTRPSLPSQFIACLAGHLIVYWLTAINPSLPVWGKGHGLLVLGFIAGSR